MLFITGDKDAIAAAKLGEAFMDVFELPCQDVCNQTESDAAALRVARQFDHGESICDMNRHDGAPRACGGA